MRRKKSLAVAFNSTFRYIDNVLSFNNNQFHSYVDSIFPSELEIKETMESSTSASYLDVLLKLDTNGKITTQLYYKQDDFNFSIINSLLDIRSVFGSRESTDKQVDVTGVSTGGLAGGRASLIGYLLCVINSSHTF
jgi:hypothetical protein